ncbi:competence type IV pilus minor pilin ComGF [Oceanobacillus halophilus]|uniref:Competence protein ComGF n=1 Tax=Oceanobacillus halophilus TaxID=930130 RepID=A0A495AEA8_9BACI|nr:ComGF family competence protein [Oceanobacillus halophilus]RKQ37784.1 hypothetical protein D8M06_02990 [Oceanobacillus halophilus]
MSEKRTKHYAYMELKNEDGFSFLSMFLALTIISTTLPLFVYALHSINQIPNYYEEWSIQQFFQFMRDEIIISNEITVMDDKIILSQDDSKISIEQFDGIIRRQSDNTGHEILLGDIQDFSFDKLPYGIRLEITNSLGDIYEKSIVYYD